MGGKVLASIFRYESLVCKSTETFVDSQGVPVGFRAPAIDPEARRFRTRDEVLLYLSDERLFIALVDEVLDDSLDEPAVVKLRKVREYDREERKARCRRHLIFNFEKLVSGSSWIVGQANHWKTWSILAVGMGDFERRLLFRPTGQDAAENREFLAALVGLPPNPAFWKDADVVKFDRAFDRWFGKEDRT